MCLLLVISILYLPFNCHYPRCPDLLSVSFVSLSFNFMKSKLKKQKQKPVKWEMIKNVKKTTCV